MPTVGQQLPKFGFEIWKGTSPDTLIDWRSSNKIFEAGLVASNPSIIKSIKVFNGVLTVKLKTAKFFIN